MIVQRVIFVCRHFKENTGSYAGFIEQMAKYFQKKGISVEIYCCRTNLDDDADERLPFARVIRFPVPRIHIPLLGMNLDYLCLAWNLRKYLRKHPLGTEEIVIANGRAALGLPCNSYILRFGQPAQQFHKNMEIAKDRVSMISRIARTIHFWFQAIMEKKCVRNARGFIFPSEQTAFLCYDTYGKKNASQFIPQAGIRYSKLSAHHRYLSNPGDLLFISAGREPIRKGLHYLESVLPVLFAEYPNIKLWYIGDQIKLRVPDWCLHRVHFTGRVAWEDMRSYFRPGTIAVFCALNEGMANALLEAMAAGCAVVTSDIEGIHEYMKSGRDGIVYPRGDSVSLREGIAKLLSDSALCQRMGKNAMKRVKPLRYEYFCRQLESYIKQIFRVENSSFSRKSRLLQGTVTDKITLPSEKTAPLRISLLRF